MDPLSTADPKLTPSVPPSPLRSLTGALMAAVMGLLLYRLTTSIIQSFAAHPTISNNTIVVNLSAAIRTLVVGLATMATGIFAFVTLGLIALAIQAALQGLNPSQTPVKKTTKNSGAE
jgi:type III secretory pathway component EscU